MTCIIYLLGLFNFDAAHFLFEEPLMCACVICIFFLLIFYLSHINLEIGVEGKGWEMHCQLAEHEAFCASLVRLFSQS